MRGNILQFLEDVRRGEVDGDCFVVGLASFLRLIVVPTNEVRTDPLGESEISDEHRDHRAAVQALVAFLARLKAHKVVPSQFLDTEFEYGKQGVNLGQIPHVCLFRGVEGLTEILLQRPSSEPLQRWSNAICAASFSVKSRQNLDPSLNKVDQSENSKGPIHKPAGTNDEAHGRSLSSTTETIQRSRMASRNTSLGCALDEVYGIREDLREDISMPGYKRAVANWDRMLQSFSLNIPQSQEFRARLSAAQLNSARILVEFWSGCIDSKRCSAVAFEVLDQAARSGLLPNDFLSDEVLGFAGEHKPTQDEYNRQYIRHQTLFGPYGPPYRWLMFRLFQVEFLPVYYDSHATDSPSILSGTRKLSAKIASSQRLAISCYKSLLDMLGLSNLAEDYEDETGSMPLTDETTRPHGTHPSAVNIPVSDLAGSDTLLTQQNQSANMPIKKADQTEVQYTKLQEWISGGEGPGIGASISTCDWLEVSNPIDNLPYYLWDVAQQTTVMTEGFDAHVEYTAISHTWGRWRKWTCPLVSVKGVKEWMIPQNSKFDVLELPKILGSVPFNTPYVWFDLVCIPQESQNSKLAGIAKQEIGRQATIFRNAKYATAWFNEIVDWNGALAAIHRLSINFLQEPQGKGRSIPRSVVDKIEKNVELNLELFDTTKVSISEPESAMDGWFSSLWTLQELCLRPDMRLCSQAWEVLSIGGTPIGIDDLVALSEGGNFPQDDPWSVVVENTANVANYISPRSTATDQLMELLDLSGLEHLLNASRATILTLGNQRYCEENRAEAIMSAVGVVNWHVNLSADKRPSKTNQYPVAFLHEASESIGAEFYGSTYGEGELLEILLPSLKESGERDGIGTMLPFTPTRLSRKPGFAEGYTGEDHPSVATWMIQPDFSVKVLKAGVLSYTNQDRSSKRSICCTIIGPSPGDPPSLLVQEHKGVDLDTWVDSFIPSTRNFAVCLHRGLGGGLSDGLLLKELSSGELIRVGTYCVTVKKHSKQINPPSYDVDWLIL